MILKLKNRTNNMQLDTTVRYQYLVSETSLWFVCEGSTTRVVCVSHVKLLLLDNITSIYAKRQRYMF